MAAVGVVAPALNGNRRKLTRRCRPVCGVAQTAHPPADLEANLPPPRLEGRCVTGLTEAARTLGYGAGRVCCAPRRQGNGGGAGARPASGGARSAKAGVGRAGLRRRVDVRRLPRRLLPGARPEGSCAQPLSGCEARGERRCLEAGPVESPRGFPTAHAARHDSDAGLERR